MAPIGIFIAPRRRKLVSHSVLAMVFAKKQDPAWVLSGRSSATSIIAVIAVVVMVVMVPVSPPEVMMVMMMVVTIVELRELHICLRRRGRLRLIDRSQQGGGIRYRFQQLGKRIGSQAIARG